MSRKYVIFTCITAGFDQLMQPSVTDPDFDFVCFMPASEVVTRHMGQWEIRPLAPLPLSPRLQSKYAKMHPHLLLSEYEYSLWIDGNVRVETEEVYDLFRQKVERGLLFSGINHPLRDDVYLEAEKIYANDWDRFDAVWRTVEFLRDQHFPRHGGLYETNVLFRAHNHPKIRQFDELWWEMVNHYSSRDQLSHTYCMRSCEIRGDHFVPEEYSARDYPAFAYVFHGKTDRRHFLARKWHGLRHWIPERRLHRLIRKIR